MNYSAESATRDVAKWIVARDRKAVLSPQALQFSEISVIDTIACMFAGLIEPGPEHLKNATFTDPKMPASVIGLNASATAVDAARINGTSAHMLDFDDGSAVCGGHPSTVVVPTILALAEKHGLNGLDLLDAHIIGWDTMLLVGAMVKPYMAARGYHVTSAVGVVAAAAAGARLLKLNVDQTATALGIAASSGSGIRANFGTDMKPYHAGCASAAAVLAVELAATGFTAAHNILEAKDGFVSVLGDEKAREGVRAHVDKLLRGDVSIEKDHPFIKFFACCHSTHSSIEAAIKIRPKVIGNLEAIQEILVETYPLSKLFLIHPRPTTGLQAKFSMEACIALALVDGKAGPAEFTDKSVGRRAVQQLIPKVKYTVSDRYDDAHNQQKTQPGNVTVISTLGTFREEVSDPYGAQLRPCTQEDVCEKFRTGAMGRLSNSEIAIADQMLGNIRAIEDIRKLGGLLRGRPSG